MYGISSDGDDQMAWVQNSRPPKIPGPKIQPQKKLNVCVCLQLNLSFPYLLVFLTTIETPKTLAKFS